MIRRTCFSRSAFTLVELLVAATVSAVIGGGIFYFLNTALILCAKNFSLNYSNSSLRYALDRLDVEVAQAITIPTLIDADGNVATSTSGPASGVRFDKYVGGPYIVTHPGGAGLPAATTTFTLKRSVASLASPPVPGPNDVIRIDNPNMTLRPRVSSCVAAAPAGNLQSLTVALAGNLGADIFWNATEDKPADLIRQVAFVVANTGGTNELRYYPTVETVTDYSNAAAYVVLTNNVGTQAGEGTPFSLVTANGRQLLNVSMRVQSQSYTRYLEKKEASEFNTFLRVDTAFRQRNFQ